MASPSDHKATIIDGKAIAQSIRNEIAAEVCHLSQKYGKVQTKPSIFSIKLGCKSLVGWLVEMENELANSFISRGMCEMPLVFSFRKSRISAVNGQNSEDTAGDIGIGGQTNRP